MIKRIFAVLLLLVLAAGALVYYAVGVPYQGFEKEVFVDIAPGTPTRGIAQMLASAGVIRADWQFLIARALYPRVTLQAGEYRFDGPMTTLAVFGKIARGDIYFFELRVPEGANIFDIAAEVERIGLARRDAFLAIARDGTIIHDIAPNAPTLEGFLFPSTYKVTRRTTPQQIVREMTNQFRRIWKEIAKEGEDVNRAVTLASLVEKETAVPAERRTVASVYHNRLEIGMRLDCDPTTIYAALLEGRWDGVIHRSDLDSPNPYNTYRNPGLPPGAIANPGTESLRAALDPAQTKFLFFVAKPDGSGGHVFTETLGEHSTAVQDYRRGNAPR